MKWYFSTHINHESVSPTNGNGAFLVLVFFGFNSHLGQNFSLSLCGPISISRANAHMVYLGRKLALHVTL